MAGYVTKAVGADAIYEGGYAAAEALQNGLFVSLNTDRKVAKLASAGDIAMVVKAKEYLWGAPAIRVDVLAQGSGGVYFVEKTFTDAGDEFDDANVVTKIGELVRMHMPLTGEELLFTVGETLYGTLAVGDAIVPAANGTVAKPTT